MKKWAVFYDSAEGEDGSFPYEKIGLTKEFLLDTKKTMGPYMYANQYLNQVIPSELQQFKKEWFQTYDKLPKELMTFAMIDPAASDSDEADYTAQVVLSVDTEANWYVRMARRCRISATELVNDLFDINDRFDCFSIGIEEVAYQKVLLHLVDEEMTKRQKVLPVVGIKPTPGWTKEMRIKTLVPRYCWRRVYHANGLDDLQMELLQFPRGKYDDLIDALAYMDKFVSPPQREEKNESRPAPNSPKYEQWYIREFLAKRGGGG